jgi:hypothetical protein
MSKSRGEVTLRLRDGSGRNKAALRQVSEGRSLKRAVSA